MAEESEGPPFSDPPNHIRVSEVQNRSRELLESHHQLVNTERDEIISSLLQTIRANGTRRTLTQLHVHNLIRSFLLRESDRSRETAQQTGMEITPEQDPGLPPRLIQFGVGLTLNVNTDTTEPQSFEQIGTGLLELMNWYSRQGGQGASHLPLDKPAANPYFGMLWRELTTLRHASGYQMIEKGYRAYKPWESEMEELLGFSIEDAVYYTRELIPLIRSRFEGPDKDVTRWASSFFDFHQEAIDIAADSVWVSEETLVEACFDSDRFHNFIDRLSVEPSIDSQFQSPVDINPLERTPFVKYDGQYLLPLPRTLMYALANTFYYDLLDSQYEGDFHFQFGNWLEQWTVDCLSKIFTSEDIIRNYTYEHDGKDVEGDILILRDEEPIVVECKGKKLRAETRRGNFGGVGSLQEDIKRGIGDAYHQADRLIDGVQSGEIDTITTSGGSIIDLKPEILKNAHRWIVLGESYGSIATRDFAKILDITPVPYVCDIYDMQVLFEVLDTPEQILHYVRQRIRQTEVQLRLSGENYLNMNIFSSDEIDYLGIYNRNNRDFPPGTQRITGAGDKLREDAIDEILSNNEFQFTH